MIRDKIDIMSTSSGNLKSYKMEIGDQGLILDIIRSKVYADPIGSICREILTNASDAHIESGISKRPIQVTLPNSFAQDLVIRDFGSGISPTRMADVYARYGVSTKTKSNDQVGSFGIGSKSVFSYTPQFTVISITIIQDQSDVDFVNESTKANHTFDDLHGKTIKSIFVPHLTDDNMGGVNLLSVTFTEEHVGLAVHIPIETKDINTFINAIIKYTFYWDVKPVILGGIITWEKDNICFSGSGWEILRDIKDVFYNSYSRNEKQNIIISNIPYPIDFNQLGSESEVKSLKAVGFNLYFETGELSVSASREQIYYNEKTKIKLIERIKQAIKDLGDTATEQVSKCSTYAEAISQSAFITRFLGNCNIFWHGNVVKQRVDIVTNRANIRLSIFSKVENNGSVIRKKVVSSEICALRTNYLVLNDVASNIVNRQAICRLLHANSNSSVIVVTFSKYYNVTQYLNDIKDQFNIDLNVLKPVYLSEFFKKSPKVVGKTVDEAYLIRNSTYKSPSYSKESVDLKDGEGIYVTHEYIQSSISRTSDHYETLAFSHNQIDSFIKTSGKKVYSLSSKQVKKIGPGWKTLISVLREIGLKEIEKNPNLLHDISSYMISDRTILTYKAILNCVGIYNPNLVSLVEKEIHNLEQIKNQQFSFSEIVIGSNNTLFKNQMILGTNELTKNLELIKEKCGMLFLFDNYDLNNAIINNFDVIERYIKLAFNN